jgi:hypothetical protein
MADVRTEEKRPEPERRLAVSDALFLVGAVWVGINIGAGLLLGVMAVMALGLSTVYGRREKKERSR